MKHAKRMVLVPEDVLNRYEQKQKIETSPITANMMHQDTAMSEILQSTDISDVEKQKMYNANMESYLSLRRQKDDQIPTVRIAPDAEQKSRGKTSLSDADVIGHLPVTLGQKAATLLRRLKARPDVFSWDESGQVKVDGKEIPDSNISDLVSDAMRARKNFNPKGAQELFCGLSKINVPKDIARNTERWNQVQMGSPSDAEEVVFKTPPPRPPPPTSPRASPAKYLCGLLRRQAAKPKQWLPY
jgi:hypothetical protein